MFKNKYTQLLVRSLAHTQSAAAKKLGKSFIILLTRMKRLND